MLERQIKSKLLALLKQFPVVAIHGARQTGKTTLAKMVTPEIPKPTVYIDLENPADLNRLADAVLFFNANRDNCVIIDEIQRQPELLQLLRSVVDDHRVPGRFIILGSASPNLLRLSSESLAGRIVFLELNPFNLFEVSHLTSYREHWLRGGFPEPFLSDDIEFRQEWYKTFVMTSIERDLPLLGLSPNRLAFQRFISMLAHGHGQILNRTTYAKSLELSVPTISEYLHYLEYAYLLRILPPFSPNLKKRLVKSPKIYFRDTGLLHYLLMIKDEQALFGHPIIGSSWEGYVINQICSVLGDRFEYFFYRTVDGAECDLLLTKNFTPVVCVEVKFTSAPRVNKGMTIACQDVGTHKNFIIVPECAQSYPITSVWEVCNLTNFLSSKINI